MSMHNSLIRKTVVDRISASSCPFSQIFLFYRAIVVVVVVAFSPGLKLF